MRDLAQETVSCIFAMAAPNAVGLPGPSYAAWLERRLRPNPRHTTRD
jgi:hypothetical protein